MSGLGIYTATVSFLLIIVVLKKLFSRHSNENYPPGPPGRVFIGNLREIPDKKPWLAYTEWAKNYGELMHLQAMGDHIVILSSADAANDLLEKRTRIYSGRPYEDVAITVGWGFNIGLQSYSDTWRRSRRMFQQILRPDAVVQLRPVIQECIGIFMQNLIESPEKFMDHIAVLSGGLALKTMYGITVKSEEDTLISIAKSAAESGDKIFAPHFIAILKCCPFIMSVPRWVPVLGHARRHIEFSQNLLDGIRELPLQQAQKSMESGVPNDGVAVRLLRDTDPGDVERIRLIKDVASLTYFAGADTTLSSTGTFFLAMAKNTQAQQRAQQEIDAIVGRGRLPTLDDRRSLPYVEAIYREVMRWYPALPIGRCPLAIIRNNSMATRLDRRSTYGNKAR
ncbi:cytochrome p450 [Moniliophthora roreri]|uniref:Cytochrome p450 n=1 Tax=Moniliophthora roreri TaxID=221103 RepID=A0A0W0F7L0_MONRR|nr:cytochrome p450 [Moniliophthora roreri]